MVFAYKKTLGEEALETNERAGAQLETKFQNSWTMQEEEITVG